jgi:SagB-type dehydrogenase family enzyme
VEEGEEAPMWEQAGWALVVMVSFWAAMEAEAGDVSLVRQYHRASSIGPQGYGEPEPRTSAPGGFKSYPGSPRFDFTPDLPRLEQLTPEALRALHAAFCRETTPLARAREKLEQGVPAFPALGKGVLGRVLVGGMGVTKVERFGRATMSYRSAPSAGALYPVELYVAAERVKDLPPGLYHYDVVHNQLEQLGGDAAKEVEGALPSASRGGAAAYVVLTGIFARTRAKYNVRAYRYVLLDAGHVAGNLALTAAAKGLGVRLLPHFDDGALNQALGLDGEEEACLLVVALDTAEAGEPAALPGEVAEAARLAGAQPARFAGSPPGTRMRPERSGTPPSALSRRVHQATCLGPEEAAALGEPEVRAAAPPEGAKLVALPLPAEPRRSLEEALVSRRSQRSFRPRPLSTEELSTLLAWPGSARPLPGLQWYLVVSSVEGVSPGVYRYWPRERALERKAPPTRAGELADAALGQDWLAEAPCVVVAVAEAGALDGPAGARWYRDAHLAAGEAGEWLYLAAEGLDLGTCAVGAFADEAVAEVLGLKQEAPPLLAWPLILYPVGPR